ncbi:MAG: hypothetical protein H0W15_02650 [Gemmatimonadales bacterium]|nr:hypothetical protein [Gemmatimonadales bacterium]
MTDNRLPARIDRTTFDRVLQRAAEIQATSRDIGEGLTEDEILALGEEVGIPVQALKQALLEERTRAVVAAPETVVDRLVGVAELSAERVVQGSQAAILTALSQWLDIHEHFVVQRATIGRTTFEPMHALAGAMRRMSSALRGGHNRPYLGRAELVAAVVTPLEAGFCHVSLAATLRSTRTSYIGGASALATAGLLGAGGVALVGSALLVPLIPVIGGLGTAWFAARAYRPVAHRAQLGLERALDALERNPALPGPHPVGPPGRIARGVGEVVREISTEVRRALEK